MAATADRVSTHTSGAVNARLQREAENRVAYFADHPEAVESRLGELDREWDVERALEANAATLALAGVALAAGGDRRWLLLPAVVTAFLLQHAVQGWCPPLPVLRRLGFRTASEIDRERYALKFLRGDFGDIPAGRASPPDERARLALETVRR